MSASAHEITWAPGEMDCVLRPSGNVPPSPGQAGTTPGLDTGPPPCFPPPLPITHSHSHMRHVPQRGREAVIRVSDVVPPCTSCGYLGPEAIGASPNTNGGSLDLSQFHPVDEWHPFEWVCAASGRTPRPSVIAAPSFLCADVRTVPVSRPARVHCDGGSGQTRKGTPDKVYIDGVLVGTPLSSVFAQMCEPHFQEVGATLRRFALFNLYVKGSKCHLFVLRGFTAVMLADIFLQHLGWMAGCPTGP